VGLKDFEPHNILTMRNYPGTAWNCRHNFLLMGSMWVLNIDDDRDDRELFCDALNEIDPTINCVAKSSAEEAIDFLNRTNTLPNRIFLDINMPRMGGIECLKTIRKNDRLAHIPITILSTTTNRREIEEVRKLGADFIAKEGVYSNYVTMLKSKIGRAS
jgi:CheY-like chemotaxis protein